MVSQFSQFEILLVSLDPTIGSEIKKTRPAIVISPDALNNHLRTLIVAPMSSQSKPAAFRVPTTWNGQQGQIVLDQLRTIDQKRILKPIGHLDYRTAASIKQVLHEMFA